MIEPQKSSAPLTGPMVGILLMGLGKVVGPSYEQLLEATPWRRYLKRPPSNDPTVAESNDEELSLVFAHIYQAVGRDLFIAFGRYAGVEGGKTFAEMLAPRVAPVLVGLTGVARLQRLIELAISLVSWAFPLSANNTSDGVVVINRNCGMCSGIKSEEPVCAFLGDGLRTCYTRLYGGPLVFKEEVCRAQGKGTDCVFRVSVG